MNITSQIGLNDAGREPVKPFLFQSRSAWLGSIIRPFVLGDFRHSAVAAINYPARTMVVWQIRVPLLMDMPHLDKAKIGIAIKLP